MLKTIAAAFLLASAARAVPGPLINGNQINPQSGIAIATFSVTGSGGMAVTNSVTASSFTATGNGFKGAGTGLTGTAASLTAGNATAAVTATNLGGGGAGQIPYQSASGTTAMLGAGNSHQVLVGGASAPAWTDAPTVSSLTTTGSAAVGGALAVSGIATASAQPAVRVYRNASQATASGTQVNMFYDTVEYTQGGLTLTNVSTSSDTVTIPAGGTGIYSVACGVAFATGATGRRYILILKNGSSTGASFDFTPTNTSNESLTTSDHLNLSSGDTLACAVSQTSGANVNISTKGSFLSAVKLW